MARLLPILGLGHFWAQQGCVARTGFPATGTGWAYLPTGTGVPTLHPSPVLPPPGMPLQNHIPTHLPRGPSRCPPAPVEERLALLGVRGAPSPVWLGVGGT